MDRDSFLRAKTFIFSDIQREISLAEISLGSNAGQLPDKLKATPGGGNFLAALGLLCYTEFAGWLKNGDSSQQRSCAQNFNAFFDALGPEYRAFRTEHNVYRILRCGLVHEYYVKKRCTIAMSSADEGIGVRWDGQKYVFVVDRYFGDFKHALLGLEEELYPNIG